MVFGFGVWRNIRGGWKVSKIKDEETTDSSPNATGPMTSVEKPMYIWAY